MKNFSKLLSFILILSTLMTAFCISPAFAAPQIKKGTTRIVIDDHEANKCEDVVVYNNKRYLPADWYVLGLLNTGLKYSGTDLDIDFEVYESVYKASNNSITLNLKPSGYATFWAGSKNVTLPGAGTTSMLINPPVFYDKRVYVSLEDIALMFTALTGNYYSYGFDYKVNTVYFY